MKNLYYIFLAILVLSACKKETPNTPLTQKRDVYTAEVKHLRSSMIIRKNGNILYELNEASAISDIFVSGNDVYAANFRGKIWRNDVEILNNHLTLETTLGGFMCSAIGVLNNDVYSVGHCTTGNQWNKGVVFKNSELLHSFVEYPINTNIQSIFIKDNDIYYVGSNTLQQPVVWKNGTELFTLENYSSAFIFVQDKNNIYTAGGTQISKNEKLLYDVNDQSAVYTTITGLSVYGNDVYTSGYIHFNLEGKRAVVWKNGQILYYLTDKTEYNSYARSIQVIDEDVYVCGDVHFPPQSYDPFDPNPPLPMIDYMAVWKNGKILYKVENTNGECSSIVVK